MAFYEGTTLLGTDTTSPYGFTWSGVAAGSYTLTAVATDNHGAQAQSLPIAITVNGAPPPVAPTSLTATAASATQVNLAWTDNANNEAGFKVVRSVDGVNFIEIASLGADSTTYSDTTVAANTLYYYRVYAYNVGGSSAWSNTATVTTPAPPPNAPTGLTATAAAKRKIRLAWTDNSTTETGFKIERSTNGTTWTQIATAGANSVSYINSSLSAGTTYYYRVRSYNAAGNSAYSNTAAATARN